MNRIKEIREAAGMSQAGLARKLGTSATQLGRLENDKRGLTLDWLQRIADALGVSIVELIQPPAAGLVDEVEPMMASPVPEVAEALSKRNLRVYGVRSDSLANLGIGGGKVITVDENITDFATLQSGDCVLVRFSGEGKSVRALRQFVLPKMLITNRPGVNLSALIDRPDVKIELIGKLLT